MVAILLNEKLLLLLFFEKTGMNAIRPNNSKKIKESEATVEKCNFR